MLQAGKFITRADEPLVKLQLDRLYFAIKNPKPEVESAVRQLRQLLTIDPKKYALAKRQLPYFVCGIFNPPFRRGENFAWIRYFVLDIDHLNEKGLDPASLKNRLSQDSRVLMAFVSPGGDGLKLVFRLSERCFDKGRFSLFYKAFAHAFGLEYQLGQVIDGVTSDVTRACFISVDPLVYFNPEGTEIDMNTFINFDSSNQIREIKNLGKQEPGNKPESSTTIKGPDDDTLLEIKKRLNPNLKVKPEKTYFVPREVDSAVEAISQRMKQENIEMTAIRSISYGKKITFRLGLKEGEINLFYGRKGYSVVQSMRTGTNKEMNEVCAAIIEDVLRK